MQRLSLLVEERTPKCSHLNRKTSSRPRGRRRLAAPAAPRSAPLVEKLEGASVGYVDVVVVMSEVIKPEGLESEERPRKHLSLVDDPVYVRRVGVVKEEAKNLRPERRRQEEVPPTFAHPAAWTPHVERRGVPGKDAAIFTRMLDIGVDTNVVPTELPVQAADHPRHVLSPLEAGGVHSYEAKRLVKPRLEGNEARRHERNGL